MTYKLHVAVRVEQTGTAKNADHLEKEYSRALTCCCAPQEIGKTLRSLLFRMNTMRFYVQTKKLTPISWGK